MLYKRYNLLIFLLIFILLSPLSAGSYSGLLKALGIGGKSSSYYSYNFSRSKLSEFELKTIELESNLEKKVFFQEQLKENNVFSKQRLETEIELYNNEELSLSSSYIETRKIYFSQKHVVEADLFIEYDAIVKEAPQLVSLLPKTDAEYKKIYEKKEISINEHSNIMGINNQILKLNVDKKSISLNTLKDLKKYISGSNNNLIPIVAHSQTGKYIIFPDGSYISSENLHMYCHNKNKSCIILSCYSNDLKIDYKMTSQDAIDIWLATIRKYRLKEISSIKDFKINLKKELSFKKNKQLAVNTVSVSVSFGSVIYTVTFYNDETKYNIDDFEQLIEMAIDNQKYYKIGLKLSNILLKEKYITLLNKQIKIDRSTKQAEEKKEEEYWLLSNFAETLVQKFKLELKLENYLFENMIEPKYLKLFSNNQLEHKYFYTIRYLTARYTKALDYKRAIKILSVLTTSKIIKSKAKIAESYSQIALNQLLSTQYNNAFLSLKKAFNLDAKRVVLTFPYEYKKVIAIHKILEKKYLYGMISTICQSYLAYLDKETLLLKDDFINILIRKIELDIVLEKYADGVEDNSSYIKVFENMNINNNENYLNRMENLAEGYSEAGDINKSIKVLNSILNSNIFHYSNNEVLSGLHGQLSWYYIFIKDYKKAIESAKKALILDKTKTWIYTNLAHGYLLSNDIKKAKEIYLKYKDKEVQNKSWREVISDDFYQFEQKGITSPHFDDIKNILF